MNQPPEQIALFPGIRARTGPDRTPEPAPEPPKPFSPHRAQLAMFMTPREIKTHYQTLIGDRIPYRGANGKVLVETNDEVWERKKEEADDEGLTASIAKHGVLSPVQLQLYDQWSPRRAQVLGGHHRIASAPEDSLIPVIHHYSLSEAREDKYYPYERDTGIEDGGPGRYPHGSGTPNHSYTSSSS